MSLRHACGLGSLSRDEFEEALCDPGVAAALLAAADRLVRGGVVVPVSEWCSWSPAEQEALAQARSGLPHDPHAEQEPDPDMTDGEIERFADSAWAGWQKHRAAARAGAMLTGLGA